MSFCRTIIRAVTVLLLALSILNGLSQAYTHLVLQQRGDGLIFAFGAAKLSVAILALVALQKVIFSPLSARPWLILWALLLSLLAGAAPMLFGRASWMRGCASTLGSALLLGMLLLLWHRLAVGKPRHPQPVKP